MNGKDYKHQQPGDIPVYGTGGIITYTNNYLCNWECVCIGRKGTINKPLYISEPFWCVDTLFYSKAKANSIPKFQYYLFQTINWTKYNEASGVPSLSLSTIENIKRYIPDVQEQQKISNFLSLIDQRIITQSKIIEDLELFKSSIMDNLLTKNYFIEMSLSNFLSSGYARVIKASELIKFDGERLYLSTSSIDYNGIVNVECKITYFNRPSRASMIPIKNSVWFAKMKNTIKVYKSENDDENKYILSTGFYGILCDENKVNSNWMLEIFKSNYFNKQKNKFSEGSSMSGIKDSQLEDIQIKIFSDKNQELKFCKLFNCLNKKLSFEQKYLEKLKEQKKYLLSNMFI